MRKPYLIGLLMLAGWIGWIIYGLTAYQGNMYYKQIYLVTIGTAAFPVYFSLLQLIIGKREKQWMSWVTIGITIILLVPGVVGFMISSKL
ncbi:hypothetical protein [Brevibacillus daliensis]|uniref:hypothetical protein n=1 Tax=Brevibacillus daliensis TaxID=2892995 RepID=UPI001E4D1EC4|nr:hypothetical protein [Brevibacillus daliensis]